MVKCRTFIALLATFAVVSVVRADESRLRALEARAVCVALASYRATSPKADLRHFQIIVGKDGKNFDIIFLPDPDPSDPYVVGGSTKFGAEVHYIISPRTYKILSTHLARRNHLTNCCSRRLPAVRPYFL